MRVKAWPVCPTCGHRLAPGHLRVRMTWGGDTGRSDTRAVVPDFETCPGGQPMPPPYIGGV